MSFAADDRKFAAFLGYRAMANIIFFNGVWSPTEICIKSVLVCTEHRFDLLQVTGGANQSEFWCSMYYNVHADKYCSDLLLLYWYYNNHRYTDTCRFYDTWVMYWWSCINIRLLYCICIYISLPKMGQFLCRSEIVHLIFLVVQTNRGFIIDFNKAF